MCKHRLSLKSDDNTVDIIVTITDTGTGQVLTSAKCSKQTCYTCDYFDHGFEKCTLVGLRPPLKTIVYGCEKWLKGIPF